MSHEKVAPLKLSGGFRVTLFLATAAARIPLKLSGSGPYAAPPRNSDAAVGGAAPRRRTVSSASGILSPSPGARNKFESTPCCRVYKSQYRPCNAYSDSRSEEHTSELQSL